MKKMMLVFGLILFLSGCTNIEDTEDPVISILGESQIVLEINDLYTEPGYEASDNIDANPVVTMTGEVDITAIGIYTLTYTATDKAGNSSSVTRVIEVVDTIDPTIELIGGLQITTEAGEEFIEPGYVAADNSNIEPTVVVTGEIDNTMVGLYTLTYTATDTADHMVSITRVVEVIDTTSPYIELNGDRFVYIELGSEYIELGVHIFENTSEILTVNIYSSLDVNMLAYFDLEYYVIDSSGNRSNTVSRGVITTLPYNGLYDSLNSIGWQIESDDVVYDTATTSDVGQINTENITYIYNKTTKELSYNKQNTTLSDIDQTTIINESNYNLRVDLVNGRGYVELFTMSFVNGETTTNTYTLEYDYYTDTMINVSDPLFEDDMLTFLGSATTEFNDLLNMLYSIQIIDFY